MALSALKRKVALVFAPILIGVFVAGVFASTTPLGGSLTSIFITNWPHSQNVSITNWPKPVAGNTTVIVKTVYVNQSTVINATRFFIIANHTIPFTGPYSQVYGVVSSQNGCNLGGPVQGGNVTFTPHNTSLPTLSTVIQTTSGYYEIDVPSNQSYLVHIFYYPCGQPLRDCFVPANPNIAIDRIDFSCID